MEDIIKSIKNSLQFAFSEGRISEPEMSLGLAFASDEPRIRVYFATFKKEGNSYINIDIKWHSPILERAEDEEIYAIAWRILKDKHPKFDADSVDVGSCIIVIRKSFKIELDK